MALKESNGNDFQSVRSILIRLFSVCINIIFAPSLLSAFHPLIPNPTNTSCTNCNHFNSSGRRRRRRRNRLAILALAFLISDHLFLYENVFQEPANPQQVWQVTIFNPSLWNQSVDKSNLYGRETQFPLQF